MHVELVTAEGSAFKGSAVSVTLPGGDGEITVLDRHIPLLSTLAPGTVIVRTQDGEHYFAVSRGILHVGRAGLRILSDIADRAEGLEEEAIEKAVKQAEELRRTVRRSDAEGFADATSTLERQIARLSSVRRVRSRRKRSLPQ